MKPSGIEWIGYIPDDWEVTKIGQLYLERNEKVSDREYEALSVTKHGILKQLESAAKTDNGDNRKLVKSGDFVINSRSDRRGSCGISKFDGSVSLINIILMPTQKIANGYYNYLFRTENFADEFYKYGNGIVDDLWSTKWTSMKKILVPFPSLRTQQRIADYLDEKCGEIDATIAKQKESIEKLKAYKQSLISETVTKGLDKSSPLKPSGIEWIGDIPAHWEVKRIKELFSFGKGLPISKEDLIENGVPVINYGQIHSKDNNGTSIKDSLIRYVDLNYKNTNMTSLVESGDFIFADTSEDLDGCGNCIYVDSKYPIFAGYHCIILRSIKRNSSKYLAYLFQMDAWRTQIRRDVTGVKVFSISKKILGKSYILLPPRYEQECIVNYLQEKCNEIDIIINKKQNIIQKLDAYKKSLIFECVTGKQKI